MAEIAELERRITDALERIGRATDNLGQSPAEPVDDGALASLQEALDAEKVANAQLEERVKAVHETQSVLEAEIEQLRSSSAAPDGTVEKLQAEIVALAEANKTLEASRLADRAELDAILSELEPLISGAANA